MQLFLSLSTRIVLTESKSRLLAIILVAIYLVLVESKSRLSVIILVAIYLVLAESKSRLSVIILAAIYLFGLSTYGIEIKIICNYSCCDLLIRA